MEWKLSGYRKRKVNKKKRKNHEHRNYQLSFVLAAVINSCNFVSLWSTSPMLIISTAMLFFFNCFPSFCNASAVSCTGQPTNTIIRWLPFLFLRCFNANCAIWIDVIKSALPYNFILEKQAKTFPASWVGDTRRSTLQAGCKHTQEQIYLTTLIVY